MSRTVRGYLVLLISLFALAVFACGVTVIKTHKERKRYPEIYCDFGSGDWDYCDRKAHYV